MKETGMPWSPIGNPMHLCSVIRWPWCCSVFFKYPQGNLSTLRPKEFISQKLYPFYANGTTG